MRIKGFVQKGILAKLEIFEKDLKIVLDEIKVAENSTKSNNNLIISEIEGKVYLPYTKEELKERLQRSIYKVVAEEGIEGVTVRKVSKGCGLSDPYIYQCYKDLFDLMDPEVIVSNIIDSTVSVAVKMHLGYMDKTALKARTIYKTVFALLFQLLHIDVWNGGI